MASGTPPPVSLTVRTTVAAVSRSSSATSPSRGPIEQELDRLKARLLLPLLQNACQPRLHLPLQRAATEAAGLAWMTPFPLLVLPLLLEEKTEATLLQAMRQEEIRERSEFLLEEVV